RQEIGALAFARAYRLECVPTEATPIRAEWIRFWEEENQTQITQIDADLKSAFHLRESAKICVSNSYERTILAVDPAVSAKETADRTALVTLSRQAAPGNQIHVREALARRVAAPELVQLIDDADRRWQPDTILFESNAAF